VTRRNLFGSVLCAAAGTCSCDPKRSESSVRLASVARQFDLAILPMLWAGLESIAISASGADAGNLRLTAPAWSVSVSLDANWIAWFPRASLPPPIGVDARKVFFVGLDASASSAMPPGVYARLLSLSAGAQRLAVTSADQRLLILNPGTGGLERDLTGLVTQFPIGSVERLCISANGQRLAVGTREMLVVLDLTPGRALLEQEGRFPCLSPDGNSIAFIRNAKELISMSVTARIGKKVVNGWTDILGLGAWSPDGSFLLAGVRGPLGFFTKLAAIDCTTGGITDIVAELPEGSLGEQSAWVSRRLLSR